MDDSASYMRNEIVIMIQAIVATESPKERNLTKEIDSLLIVQLKDGDVGLSWSILSLLSSYQYDLQSALRR